MSSYAISKLVIITLHCRIVCMPVPTMAMIMTAMTRDREARRCQQLSTDVVGRRRKADRSCP